MNLPAAHRLPVEHLSACFNDVTNSYKFYWFLAILECVRDSSEPTILIQALLARMIGSIWYPVNYFRLSFGKQDQLGSVALKLQRQLHLLQDAKKRDVIAGVETLLKNSEEAVQAITKEANSFAKYVPYRFLSPWFANELRGKLDNEKNKLISRCADKHFSLEKPPLYRFTPDGRSIEIHRDWFDYLKQHHAILSGFCLWHLTIYLQKNNPNASHISEKLFEPQQRDLKDAKKFWGIVLSEHRNEHCIYSDAVLGTNESIDHFLPWSFVAHDLIWNLLPVPKSVNSAKSDKLPSLPTYLDKFLSLQHRASRTVYEKNGDKKLLEDYSMLYKKESEEIYQMSPEIFKGKLSDNIKPLVEIAANMGFMKRLGL